MRRPLKETVFVLALSPLSACVWTESWTCPDPATPTSTSNDSPTLPGDLYADAAPLWEPGNLSVKTSKVNRCERGAPVPIEIHAPEDGLLSLAYQARSSKDEATAVEIFEAALEKFPESINGNSSLARLLATTKNAKLRDPERAVKLAEVAVRVSKRDDHKLEVLGIALHAAGRLEEAVKISPA